MVILLFGYSIHNGITTCMFGLRYNTLCTVSTCMHMYESSIIILRHSKLGLHPAPLQSQTK